LKITTGAVTPLRITTGAVMPLAWETVPLPAKSALVTTSRLLDLASPPDQRKHHERDRHRSRQG